MAKFKLPGKVLSESFNSTGVETQAIPNYQLETDDVKVEALADFKSVLLGLASPEVKAFNRAALFPVDLETQLKTKVSVDERNAFDVVEGKSAMGFNLSVLVAANGKNPVHLFVIEDTVRKKILVAADANVGIEFQDRLADGGVQYVDRHNFRAADKINDFLVEGAMLRGDKNMLMPSQVPQIVEDLIKGFCILQDVNSTNPGFIDKGTTVGKIIHECNPNPACFISVMKPAL